MQKKSLKKKFKDALQDAIDFYGKYGYYNRMY